MELSIRLKAPSYNSVYHFITDSAGEVLINPYDIQNKELYTDQTAYSAVFLNDPIVVDMHLYKGLQRLIQHDNAVELYYDYLSIRHPTYTYH